MSRKNKRNQARTTNQGGTTMAPRDDVDVEEIDAPEEEVAATEGGTEAKPKAKKEPARGDLPEGYVTPVGFAAVLGERGLQKDREGNVLTEVRPQMVYSYMKNAPKEDPFPIETVTDSIGKERQALTIEKGVEWWTRKNERTAQRAANAAEKARKKEERAAAKANEGESAEAEAEAPEEAE